METQILSYCDGQAINNVAANVLFELNKSDWSADSVLMNMITRLSKENGLLTDSIGNVRIGKYTLELQEADAILDKDFICLKKFVAANSYVQDATISANADKVWKMIEAHNPNLHRLGYEKQIALMNSLLADLERDTVKPFVDSLFGVSEGIARVKASSENFEAVFRKSIEEGASQTDAIPISDQKKMVRELINKELLPYLGAMSKVLPDKYSEITRLINGYVESINTKARARKTRNTNQEPVISELEE